MTQDREKWRLTSSYEWFYPCIDSSLPLLWDIIGLRTTFLFRRFPLERDDRMSHGIKPLHVKHHHQINPTGRFVIETIKVRTPFRLSDLVFAAENLAHIDMKGVA